MMRRYIAILFLLFLSNGQNALGELLRENYESVRGAGMGNAFVAVVDDSNALWQNPAALAYVKGNHFNLIDFTLGVDGLGTLNRLKNLIFQNDSSGFLTFDRQYSNINFKPTFISKYFGFSIYNQTFGFFNLAQLEILGFTIPSADVYAYNDTAAIFGFGIPVTPYVAFGANVRGILRTAIDANVSAQDLLAQLGLVTVQEFEQAMFDYLKTTAGTGYGIGLTLGMQAKIPLGAKDSPLLTLAGVVEDVGNTSFTKITENGPAALKMNFISGASLTYPLGKFDKLIFATELRHMFEPINFSKSIHAGLEYRHRYFSLRAGWSEGRYSAGFSWELLPHTKVHFATYGKEFSTDYLKDGQRWYVAQFIIGFAPY